MQRSLISAVLLAFLSSHCGLAQDRDQDSNIEHRDGLLVETLHFSDSAGTISAYAYLPQTPRNQAGVVFSHSKLRSDRGETDLLPLAESLARGGAVVVILDRTLLWRTGDDLEENRNGGGLVLAAEDWVLSKTNVDLERFAYVGPRFHDPNDNNELGLYTSKPRTTPRRPIWVPLGEPNSDSRKSLADPSSKLNVMHYLQSQLQLAVKQE